MDKGMGRGKIGDESKGQNMGFFKRKIDTNGSFKEPKSTKNAQNSKNSKESPKRVIVVKKKTFVN